MTTPLTWDEVCERFHQIRVRAHAHSLQDDWRALVSEPGTPTAALLSRWQRLVAEIERRDAGRDDTTVRYGDDEWEESETSWLDAWEPEPEEYGCPGGLCGRVRTAELMTPRCWLLDRKMRPVGPGADPAADGTH
jgi:hypothetical protein